MNEIPKPVKESRWSFTNVLITIGSIAGLSLIAVFIFIVFSFNGNTNNQKDEIRKSKIEISEKSKIDTVKTQKLSKLFTENTDKFEQLKWIEPKSKPTYRNQNGFYCYFSQKDNTPGNFRFVGQYASSDWLFAEKITFNIDGENFLYVPKKMEKDNNTEIWEWFDDPIDRNYLPLIRRIANANKVSVRWQGDTYSDDQELSKSNIKSIKNTLDYYESLGGTF